MKLLVTGGAGFIGANFILYWMKKHPADSIVNFDALTYAGNLENLAEVEKNPRYQFIKGDITDRVAVQKAMTGVEIVVHFAAESHVDRSISGPSVFVSTNILGTQILLDVAKDLQITRFHHVSTDEVFGSLELGSSQKFSETTRYDPASPYSASKASSDHLVRAYFHTYNLPVTITNCSNNFGPFHHPEKLIPLAITNLLEGKKVPVYGDGKNVRDWLYVEDHCSAIEAVVTKGRVGETYCVGGISQEISNLEVVQKIITLMGKNKEAIEFIKDRPGHDRRYAIDWSKIKTELDWAPLHDFETYLKSTIEWYKTHKSWWKHVKNGEYQTYYSKHYSG
jgi:dTDP-glucose 4,6-dehydratase